MINYLSVEVLIGKLRHRRTAHVMSYRDLCKAAEFDKTEHYSEKCPTKICCMYICMNPTCRNHTPAFDSSNHAWFSAYANPKYPFWVPGTHPCTKCDGYMRIAYIVKQRHGRKWHSEIFKFATEVSRKHTPLQEEILDRFDEFDGLNKIPDEFEDSSILTPSFQDLIPGLEDSMY